VRSLGRVQPSLVALMIGLSPAGCTKAVEKAPPFSQELAALLASAPVVAGRDTTHPDGELGSVRHARLLNDGAGLVVSDFAPPFLRVFDRTGRLIDTALPQGGGPREARSVWALGVSGDNGVLVLTSTGLREFAFEADSLRFVDAHPIPSGYTIVTVASHCNHGWVAYTPPRTESLAEAPMLAVADRDASGRLVWKRRLNWPTYAPSRAWGKSYQMASDGERVYLRHDYHPRAPILAIPCDPTADSVTVLRETREAPEEATELTPVSDRGAVAIITYPDVFYTGFAKWEGALIESETTTDRAADGSTTVTTTFSVTDIAGRRSLVVPGDWRIMDARNGDLLISAQEPDPRVVLLRAEALVHVFSEERYARL